MSSVLMKSLPRRTVLRGLGATMAPPFLDAMLPAFSRRALATAKPAHRFQTFYVPNGMAMEYWSPKGEGSGFELSPILEPLAAYRNQMLVLSGLRASWNYIHAGASGSFLTGTARAARESATARTPRPRLSASSSPSPCRSARRRSGTGARVSTRPARAWRRRAPSRRAAAAPRPCRAPSGWCVLGSRVWV